MGTAHNNSDDVLIIIITIIATSIPCQLCQAFDQGHNLQLYPTQKYLGKRAEAGGTQIHLPSPLSLRGLLVETMLTQSKGRFCVVTSWIS